jgi:hypothetical protein
VVRRRFNLQARLEERRMDLAAADGIKRAREMLANSKDYAAFEVRRVLEEVRQPSRGGVLGPDAVNTTGRCLCQVLDVHPLSRDALTMKARLALSLGNMDEVGSHRPA